MAGRTLFYRWSKDGSGKTVSVRASGCSAGFEKLRPLLQQVLREETLGTCRITAAPLIPFLETAAAAIHAQPEITLCPNRCLRCMDALAGGPVLSEK
jgi:aminoglycoside 3-N-acetyltransferase